MLGSARTPAPSTRWRWLACLAPERNPTEETMKLYESIHVCDWCDTRIKGNPFTRSFGDEVFLYCSEACRTNHADYGQKVRDYQSRFNFDVVIGRN